MKKKRIGLVLCLTAAGLVLNAAAVFAEKPTVTATQPNYSPSEATLNAPPNPNEIDKQLANVWSVPTTATTTII